MASEQKQITSIRGRKDQAIFFRRRHQPRRPPPAKIRPGSPAPAMGPGTADTDPATVEKKPGTDDCAYSKRLKVGVLWKFCICKKNGLNPASTVQPGRALVEHTVRSPWPAISAGILRIAFACDTLFQVRFIRASFAWHPRQTKPPSGVLLSQSRRP
jgi:hypothetical protein